MKILLVTKNWLGDILFEFPTIEAIRRQYPEAHMACLAPARCHELLESHPAIDRVILFDERREHRPLWKRLQLVWQLRGEKWDQVYLFHRSRTRAFLLMLAGAKERIGFEKKGRQLFLTRFVPEPEPGLHQVDHFLELMRGIGIPCPERPPYRFYLKDKDRRDAEGLLARHGLKHFACFHLGANWEPKRWPSESFARLADMIFQKWALPVVITGSGPDEVLAREVMGHVREARALSLVGKMSLGALGAFFQKSLFLVSADSGPLHIASGVGTPVVGLYGPTNPQHTGPRGTGDTIVLSFVPPGFYAPWYGNHMPKEGWMAMIKPEEVMEAIEKKGWVDALRRAYDANPV